MCRTILPMLAATILVATPSSAQTEAIKRLAVQLSGASTIEGPTDQLHQVLTKPYHDTAHVVRGVTAPDSIESAATETVRYQYDDNSFESGLNTEGYAIQVAQRFRLRDEGRIRWLEACFWRSASDLTSAHALAFDILSDRNGSPGSSIIGGRELIKEGVVASYPRDTCFRLNYSQRVSRGDLWVVVLFFGDDGISQNGLPGEGKALSGDTGSPRNTVVRGRLIEGSGGEVTGVGPWRDVTNINAFGIRMAVDHETQDPNPDPDPDPDPPPTQGPCLPTTDVLQFDGGYRISMCYVTHQGETGQAKAGVWASSQSGILWFFSRENAEVLVKVLDGCRHNGHRWVFVAPVTDVGFELRVTAPDGKVWTHTQRSWHNSTNQKRYVSFQVSLDKRDLTRKLYFEYNPLLSNRAKARKQKFRPWLRPCGHREGNVQSRLFITTALRPNCGGTQHE